MPNYIDNPHTRAQTECPLCKGTKSEGLVTCWPCYRRHDMRSGTDVVSNRLIATFEASARQRYWAQVQLGRR